MKNNLINNGKDYRLSVTIPEAARMLSISTKSVYRLIDRGIIKSSRALRTHLIPIIELERFLQTTMV
jgi:excisionase family DNA binding protein